MQICLGGRVRDLAFRRRLLVQYTENKPLPLDIICDEDLKLLLEGISKTFKKVKTVEENYNSVDELALNSLMESNFSRIIELDAKLNNKIVAVIRGPESINYNGISLDSRPDFRVIMRDSFQRKFSIIIEAKILDGTKSAMTNYCAEGIERFVTGKYAWDVSKAVMIAYLRDTPTLFYRLTVHLETGTPPNTEVYSVKEMPTTVPIVQGDVSTTSHDRDFKYIHRKKDTPGPIKLYHIGLS